MTTKSTVLMLSPGWPSSRPGYRTSVPDYVCSETRSNLAEFVCLLPALASIPPGESRKAAATWCEEAGRKPDCFGLLLIRVSLYFSVACLSLCQPLLSIFHFLCHLLSLSLCKYVRACECVCLHICGPCDCDGRSLQCHVRNE